MSLTLSTLIKAAVAKKGKDYLVRKYGVWSVLPNIRPLISHQIIPTKRIDGITPGMENIKKNKFKCGSTLNSIVLQHFIRSIRTINRPFSQYNLHARFLSQVDPILGVGDRL